MSTTLTRGFTMRIGGPDWRRLMFPFTTSTSQPAATRMHFAPNRPEAAPESDAFTVKTYTDRRQREWDAFLKTAKNATFLFARGYLDYHRDRFADHSLMVYHGNKLIALLPANLAADGTLVSHEGLTYGGLVVDRTASLGEVLACFHAALRQLHRDNISVLRYKPIPAIYNPIPTDDLAYALFLLKARLYRRDCATVVPQADRLPLQRRRKAQIERAAGHGVRIVQESSFQSFWEKLLVPQLAARHEAKPVHTLAEITLLAGRFPENIKQFSAYDGEELVAGTTIYETPTVARGQYAAVSAHGRKLGAQALLFNWLITDHYRAKRFFDFGTSCESEGRVINHGLLDWKEGFGGRTCMQDYYEIAPANYVRLEAALPGHLSR